jgi:hypothetical protein
LYLLRRDRIKAAKQVRVLRKEEVEGTPDSVSEIDKFGPEVSPAAELGKYMV